MRASSSSVNGYAISGIRASAICRGSRYQPANGPDLRYMVKQMTSGANTLWSLSELLQKLNPVLRGWGNYYRFCTGASRQLAALDFYVGDCIWRWLMKSIRSSIVKGPGWCDNRVFFVLLASYGVKAMSSS